MFTQLYSGVCRAPLAGMFLISTVFVVVGCASNEKRTDSSSTLALAKTSQVDPYEGFNRSMYGFNMGLDKYFFKPVSDSYKFVTPDFMETGVSNFFNNLKGINVVLNDVLQGKFEQSASDTGRFLTNTTIGLVGLVDVASDLGMQNNIEDFGQTLAVWGVDEGAYLVLPIMGPTTIRDGSAVIVDKAANPGTYVPGTGIIEGINDRANADGALNFIDEAALDPYVFTRESFLQYRRNLINDGKGDANSYELDLDEALDDFAAPKEPSKTKKPDANSSSKLDGAAVAPLSSAKSTVSVDTSAFDRMSESFEQASIKMDQLSKKKVRFKYR
jgi:phospholipid-binding lipoprotein MlaA